MQEYTIIIFVENIGNLNYLLRRGNEWTTFISPNGEKYKKHELKELIDEATSLDGLMGMWKIESYIGEYI
jgi:hypothetical protein